MIERKPTVITVLAGETLDISSGVYNQADMCIDMIVSTGVSINVSARTKENSAGEKSDHAVLGVFAASDAACPTFYGSVLPGPFDKVYVKTGATAVRCILKPYVQTFG